MPRPAFVDLPEAERLAFRSAVAGLGGAALSYTGAYVLVAVPYLGSTSEGRRLVDAAAAAFDLTRDDDGHYFPLGGDNPPDVLRHPIPWKYGEARGFWYFLHYRPKGGA